MMDWFDRFLDWQDEHPRFMQIVVLVLAAITLLELWSVSR
jgi:hypothetical protein